MAGVREIMLLTSTVGSRIHSSFCHVLSGLAEAALPCKESLCWACDGCSGLVSAAQGFSYPSSCPCDQQASAKRWQDYRAEEQLQDTRIAETRCLQQQGMQERSEKDFISVAHTFETKWFYFKNTLQFYHPFPSFLIITTSLKMWLSFWNFL